MPRRGLAGTAQRTVAHPLVAGVLNTFAVRIPVVGGETLALWHTGSAACVIAGPGGSEVARKFGAEPALGDQFMPNGATGARLVNLSAVIEADADSDGFGDESQDQCPTDGTIQSQCPDTTTPSVDLSKTPKKNSKSRTATFKFGSDESGATFTCAIDKKALKPCESPKKLRKLKPRKHKFKLVATDAVGNAGTQTTFRWRVVD